MKVAQLSLETQRREKVKKKRHEYKNEAPLTYHLNIYQAYQGEVYVVKLNH